jgi:hypothetical protein
MPDVGPDPNPGQSVPFFFKRTQEHLKKNGTDWPGFGSGPTSGIGFTIDDLWDDPAAAARERQEPSSGGLNTFNLSPFNSNPQNQISTTSSAGTPGVSTPSWNTFNEVWPSSPADPHWTHTSDASAVRTGTFGSLSTGSTDTGLGSSNLNLNPTLSSIWNTPTTTTNDDMQKLKSPNDFSQPPPSTSSWPMYQQQQKRLQLSSDHPTIPKMSADVRCTWCPLVPADARWCLLVPVVCSRTRC